MRAADGAQGEGRRYPAAEGNGRARASASVRKVERARRRRQGDARHSDKADFLFAFNARNRWDLSEWPLESLTFLRSKRGRNKVGVSQPAVSYHTSTIPSTR